MLVWVWNIFVSYHDVPDRASTYMSVFMSICMCVCLGECLHRCMYMSRTHNTRIHAHTTHTPHNSEFSTQLFSKSLSALGRNIRITQTNQHIRVKYPILLFCFVLFCTFLYVRMYVSVCGWSDHVLWLVCELAVKNGGVPAKCTVRVSRNHCTQTFRSVRRPHDCFFWVT